jgi:hypothetical protein
LDSKLAREERTHGIHTSKQVHPGSLTLNLLELLFMLDLPDHHRVFSFGVITLHAFVDPIERLDCFIGLALSRIVPGTLWHEDEKDDPESKRHPFGIDGFQVVFGVCLVDDLKGDG